MTMNRRTLYSAASLLAVGAMLLAACGGTPTSTGPAATESPEVPSATTEAAASGPVELLYFHPCYGEAYDAWNQGVVDEFNRLHEGSIHVTFSCVDEETYKTKLLIDVRSSTPPDIFFNWSGAKAKVMVDAGYAEPLDRYYADYGWDTLLAPPAVNIANIGGSKYSLGYGMAALVYWYRPDILEEYGIAVPTTWDELTAAGEILKSNGVSPDMCANLYRWPAQFYWQSWLVNKHGVDVLQGLFDRSIPWTDPRSVEAFATVQNLASSNWFYPGINSLDLDPSVIPFSQGEAAFMLQGIWMMGWFVDPTSGEETFPVDYMPYPSIGDGEPVAAVWPDLTLMIHSASPHKDEAAKFVDFLVSEENQSSFAGLNFELPSNLSVNLDDVSGAPPLWRSLGEMVKQAGQDSWMPLDLATPPEISEVFLDSLQAVIAGEMTPEDAAAAVEAAAVSAQGS